MKNLLNFLPTWKNVKPYFNILYYVGFFFWFVMKTIMIGFADYVITTNDIFMSLSFIVFLLYDIYDTVKK